MAKMRQEECEQSGGHQWKVKPGGVKNFNPVSGQDEIMVVWICPRCDASRQRFKSMPKPDKHD